MKMNFNNFFEMMKVFVYSELNKNFFKEDTQERVTKCLLKLDENKSIPSTMVDEVAELLTTSAEDGFENGFKVACELLNLIFNPNGSKTDVSNKRGIPFNDETIFDMLYYDNKIAETVGVIYPKELEEKMLKLNSDLKRKINPTNEKDFQLFDELDEIKADLSAECFKSGLFTGINLMKYLLK